MFILLLKGGHIVVHPPLGCIEMQSLTRSMETDGCPLQNNNSSCVESDKCLLVTKLTLIELEPVLIHNTAIMICKPDQIVYTKIEIFIGTNKEL